MISHYFILPTAILASLGIIYYLYLSYLGKVKPNSVSWFFWGFSPFIAYVIMIQNGVAFWDSIPIFLAWTLNFLVFLVSIFNKNSHWKLQKTDYIFAISAIVSIYFWLVLDNPFLALSFAILGDFLAGLPTLYKCYKYPNTESALGYGLSIPNLAVGILVLPTLTFFNASYTVWILLSNILKVCLILRNRF